MHLARRLRHVLIACGALAATCARADVSFHGLSEELERNARALVPLASVPCNAARWRVERLFRNADRDLREALEALGYYRFASEKLLSFDDPDCWAADFTVEPGEPVRWRSVDVTINGDARGDGWLAQQAALQRPVVGSVLDHGAYERYKRFLLSAVRTRGYFDAEAETSRVIVDETLTHADMTIVIASGPRYRFGDVTYSDPVLDPDLLAGYAEFRPGDPYDAAAITELHESLSGSGYFGSVSIAAEPAEDGSLTVPVVVTLTPGMRRAYTVGLGFATDSGIQGRLGYTDRRRNEAGHQFDSRLFLSEVDSSISADYRWPRGDPKAEWVNLYGGYQHKRTDTSESDKVTLGVRVSRNRGRNWLETPYVSFTGEDFRVGEQVAKSRLIIPGIAWESTIGREISRIRSGRRLNFDLRGSHDELGSDTTFLQLKASAKWALAVGAQDRILARADLGATTKRELEELPATVRFFAGGDNSVRGYGFETIGPVDGEGNVIGGSNLATFSIEYDRLVLEKWSIAAFVDTGSAFNGTDVDFSTGIGLGLRWYSPLGPIRADVAHPLDDPDSDFRLHLTLGPDL